MKKKIFLLTVAFLMIVSAVVGIHLYTDYKAKQIVAEKEKTQSELAELKKETLQFLSKEHTSDEIEEVLIYAFEKLPERDCTDIVDTYIYGTYNTAAQFTLTDDETNTLYRYVISDGKFDFSQMEDGKIKNMIEDRSAQHIVLRYLNGAMYWDIDYGYFDKTFGKYVIPDYRDMIHFYAEERTRSYYDDTSSKLYTDIVIDRMEKAYHLTQIYPDSDILYFMEDSYYFYKAAYLGAYAQDYIFKEGKIRTEIMDSYKKYKDTCSDPELASFLQELINNYMEVDNTRTIPIYEKIKDFCGFYISDTQPTESLEIVPKPENSTGRQ